MHHDGHLVRHPSLTAGESYSFVVRAATPSGQGWSNATASNSVTITAAQPLAADALPSASTDGVGMTVTDPVTGAIAHLRLARQAVSVSVSGFMPGTTAYLYVYSTPVLLAQASIGAGGNLTQTVTIPSNLAAGSHHLGRRGSPHRARWPTASRRSRVPRSRPTASTDNGLLAATGGSSPIGMLAVGAVLLLTGTAAVGAGVLRTRRRRV